MNNRLAGKVAVITGATSGIGTAHAKRFAEAGAKVLLCGRQIEVGKSLADEIRQSGGDARFAYLEVSDEKNWQAVVEEAVKSFGKLTTLVNNAGMLKLEGVEAETFEGYNRVIAVNQASVWLGMKTAMPEMLKAGNAAIVNISSIGGLVGVPFSIAYQASKGAIRLMTKSAAMEYAQRGVRVNTVFPGAIKTPMLGDIPEESVQAVPLRMHGAPDDIAYCSLYLCSDEARFVTGADFVVDGGVTAQ